MLLGILGEKKSLTSLMDPPCSGLAQCEVGAVAGLASGRGPVVVEGGVPGAVGFGESGSFGFGVVARRVRFLVGDGLALGCRLGSVVERSVGDAAIPGGGAVRAWVGAGRWGRVACSGRGCWGWLW